MIIAIDGPAGAGKSTIAKRLASLIGYTYIDSGAMYRALTLYILRNDIPIDNKQRIIDAAHQANINFKDNRIFLEGENVELFIREDSVNQNVSIISAIPEIRQVMVDKQRAISKGCNIVMDGRDIGTVVFPFADVKLYITASLEERALRRYKEEALKDTNLSLDQIRKSIEYRDNIDSNREVSPLKIAEDGIVIDTTSKSIDEVVDIISAIIRNKEKF